MLIACSQLFFVDYRLTDLDKAGFFELKESLNRLFLNQNIEFLSERFVRMVNVRALALFLCIGFLHAARY